MGGGRALCMAVRVGRGEQRHEAAADMHGARGGGEGVVSERA